jgi:hypothetical protein
VAELMNEHATREDCIVVNYYFASELRRVADNQSASEFAVVSYVHILHKQVVGAYNSFAL